MIEFHGNMTKEKFFLEWFGIFEGREIGTDIYPHRNWTNNPNDLIEFVRIHEKRGGPIWITAQPFRFVKRVEKNGHERYVGEACAIEKLFFDFDDDSKYCPICKNYILKDNLIKNGKKGKGGLCPICENECIDNPRLDVIKEEVLMFLDLVSKSCLAKSDPFDPEPFIVQTYKGYHVYYFLVEIFQFQKSHLEFAKELYRELQDGVISGSYEYKFLDDKVKGDISRFARVPLTLHEKTGKQCLILDRKLEPTKIRDLENYKMYGIPSSFIHKTIQIMEYRKEREAEETARELNEFDDPVKPKNGNFQGQIRPCFLERMESGEMNHAQRLAWLSEIYHSGYDTKEKMLELCKKFNDFDEEKSKQQINDYFDHERWKWNPYKCDTIRAKGWCLNSDKCKTWTLRYKH